MDYAVQSLLQLHGLRQGLVADLALLICGACPHGLSPTSEILVAMTPVHDCRCCRRRMPVLLRTRTNLEFGTTYQAGSHRICISNRNDSLAHIGQSSSPIDTIHPSQESANPSEPIDRYGSMSRSHRGNRTSRTESSENHTDTEPLML